MKFIKMTRRIFSLFLITSGVCAAEDLDLSLFNVQRLNEHTYVFSQDYGISRINFAVVIGEHDAALVTAMMRDYSKHVQSLINQITDKKIEYVFALDGDYYQYHGSRLFVENGATLIARENLIPNEFANRIFVSSERAFNLKSEVITAIPTNAHNEDHMMLKLEKGNVIFAGDAVGFDWIVYSGKNGPRAHIAALKDMLSLVDENTKIFPGNWTSKQFGNKNDLENFIALYTKFVDQVFSLSRKNITPQDIASDETLHSLLRELNSYDIQKEYLVHYVNDVLGVR